MSKTWILAADAGNARILERGEEDSSLSEVIFFSRPLAFPAKDKEASSKTGSPQDGARDYFVDVLAQSLKAGIDSHRFDRIILVAPRKFLDLLTFRLSSKVFDAVVGEVPHDLVELSLKALQAQLSRVLPDEIHSLDT